MGYSNVGNENKVSNKKMKNGWEKITNKYRIYKNRYSGINILGCKILLCNKIILFDKINPG
jgi:hypothetical protein